MNKFFRKNTRTKDVKRVSTHDILGALANIQARMDIISNPIERDYDVRDRHAFFEEDIHTFECPYCGINIIVKLSSRMVEILDEHRGSSVPLWCRNCQRQFLVYKHIDDSYGTAEVNV